MPSILLRHVKNNSDESILLICHGEEWTLSPSEEQLINIALEPCSSPDEYLQHKLLIRIGLNIHILWLQDDKLKHNNEDEYDPDAEEIEIPNYQPGDNIKLICTDVDILGEVDDE